MPPFFVHRITRYDPADRDEHGHYTGAEEAVSDHGPVEAAYLAAIAAFAEASGIDRLEIRDPAVTGPVHFGAEPPDGGHGLGGLFPPGRRRGEGPRSPKRGGTRPSGRANQCRARLSSPSWSEPVADRRSRDRRPGRRGTVTVRGASEDARRALRAAQGSSPSAFAASAGDQVRATSASGVTSERRPVDGRRGVETEAARASTE
ncbi:hypothetical protein GCM10010232_65200 [Streptomyces amakusaensis]